MTVLVDGVEEDVKRNAPQLGTGRGGTSLGIRREFLGTRKKRRAGNRKKRALKTCDALSLSSAQPLIMATSPLCPSLTVRLPKKTEYSPCPSCSCPFGTHSQLTQHISQNFDRSNSSVFRGRHLRVADKGIGLPSKGPSLPTLGSDYPYVACPVAPIHTILFGHLVHILCVPTFSFPLTFRKYSRLFCRIIATGSDYGKYLSDYSTAVICRRGQGQTIPPLSSMLTVRSSPVLPPSPPPPDCLLPTDPTPLTLVPRRRRRAVPSL